MCRFLLLPYISVTLRAPAAWDPVCFSRLPLAPISAKPRPLLGLLGHWDSERGSDLPMVTQQIGVWAGIGIQPEAFPPPDLCSWDPPPLVWVSLEDAMAPDPAGPSLISPAPLGPPNLGPRACQGWLEAWESGQSLFSLRPLRASSRAPCCPLSPFHSLESTLLGQTLWRFKNTDLQD